MNKRGNKKQSIDQTRFFPSVGTKLFAPKAVTTQN